MHQVTTDSTVLQDSVRERPKIGLSQKWKRALAAFPSEHRTDECVSAEAAGGDRNLRHKSSTQLIEPTEGTHVHQRTDWRVEPGVRDVTAQRHRFETRRNVENTLPANR